MSDQAFDIKTPSDFYKQLLIQYEEFRTDSTSARQAINCALWAYHMCDWIKGEFGEHVPFSQCPSLEVVRDVINGAKHLRITRYNPSIVSSENHKGDFSDDFNNDFDISFLSVTTAEGKVLDFGSELEKVVHFWSSHPLLAR